MGAGRSGNFGNTKGSQDGATALDYISNGLALASLIPGVDTVTDILSIPVDIARKDWLSVGFDLVGIIPWVGEPSDAAKLARITDKVSDVSKASKKIDRATDAVKATKKATSFSDFPKNIHLGRQGKHILGHNNYKKGKSILDIETDSAQKLINKYSGKGHKVGLNREKVNFKQVIGKYVDPDTGKAYDTTVGTIHYSKSGTHIVPDKPIDWRK